MQQEQIQFESQDSLGEGEPTEALADEKGLPRINAEEDDMVLFKSKESVQEHDERQQIEILLPNLEETQQLQRLDDEEEERNEAEREQQLQEKEVDAQIEEQ